MVSSFASEGTYPLHHFLTLDMITYSTNFITWDKAYSTFPHATLIDRRTYPLDM
ncbi:hypothetical protein P280DRAFT_242618 [Massarina eburnea CBS 473.64]|uniref:Uncharacterized protein n=1 Tax=Massarina eburnea CBS 473.64 TaxID=1395130 RepID=A0A6A6S7R6_9PLEO|nr:hypothetical protein P280DRAFT_242618 [Massarina eburnea CBS 473.64]